MSRRFLRRLATGARYAAALAERRGLELSVLYVETNGEAGSQTDVLRHLEDELRTFVAATKNAHGTIHVGAVFGPAVQASLPRQQPRSDLIVIGTQGRRLGKSAPGFDHGAGAQSVSLPGPYGSSRAVSATQFRGRTIEPNPVRNRFFSMCMKALDFALWSTREEDARLILLNAVAWPANVLVAEPLPILMDALPTRTELKQEAYKRLVAAMPVDDSVRRRIEVAIATGDPSDAILRVAADNKVKLIVMGIQSRSTTNLAVFGSTTRRVIQAARCPVLSIRAQQHEEGWPIPKGSL